MQNIKSHKTIEQIAKKHGVDISFIEKQLEIGEPIEHEHTKDHDLAKDIALQHLGEIPDYYTRLKRMEKSAKKEMKEHCGCEDDAVKELETGLKKLDDISYNSIDKLMRRIMKKYDMTAKQLHYAFKDKHNKIPDDWIKDLKEGTLHHWFKGSKSKDGKPGWVQADGSPCANEPGETKTPKCFSSSRLSSLKRKGEKGEALIRSAVRRKRQEDPGQQQKSGGAKPTMVKTFAKGKKDPNYIKAEPGIKEEMEINEAQKDRPGKGSGKKDACYHKVKSRYDVWPSAYASGALVKCRKVGAANWGTKKEEVTDTSLSDVDLPVNMPPVRGVHVDYEKRYCPKCKKEELRSECQYGTKYWDMYSIPTKLKDMFNKEEKDHEHSMARSQLSTIDSAVKRLKKKMKGEGNIEAWVQSKITKAADYLDAAADYIDSGEHNVDEMKCWPGYKKKGTQELFGKKYNRCVKVEDVTLEDAEGNTFAEVIDLITPEPIKGFKSQVTEASRMQAQTGNVVSVTLTWRGKYYSLKIFFPQVKLPSRKDINNELQKVYPGSKVVYHSVSEIQPGQPLIQAFGPQGGSSAKLGSNRNYVKPMGEEFEVEEDWQKINRKDKTDGLSQKAVDAYRRENPGSKLQTAVTEKNPTGNRKDRKNAFCRRMSGMKKRLTSAKTARDPNSRINKALNRWNCN